VSYNAVYRGGRVHVLAEQCSSCVFRPGNLMRLVPGRLAGMVRDAVRDDSCIPCHETIYDDTIRPAVCRGFFDRHATQPLQVADRLGLIEWDPVPA
jgi:hypothetical protein